jgi:hypothetical protein
MEWNSFTASTALQLAVDESRGRLAEEHRVALESEATSADNAKRHCRGRLP